MFDPTSQTTVPTFEECVARLHDYMRDGLSTYKAARQMQHDFGFDSYKLEDAARVLPPDLQWRVSLLGATPAHVWDQYAANGYTPRQAVEMEMSYAG